METTDYNTYMPDKYLKLGFRIWVKMLQELIKSRDLIWRLFVRDFLAKYKQTVLGVLWAIIMPLLMIGTFVFLNRTGVLNIGKTDVPYPIFALVGLSIWQLFAAGLTIYTNRVLCEKEESNLCEWNNLPQILTVERSNDTYQFLKLKQIWEIIKC